MFSKCTRIHVRIIQSNLANRLGFENVIFSSGYAALKRLLFKTFIFLFSWLLGRC